MGSPITELLWMALTGGMYLYLGLLLGVPYFHNHGFQQLVSHEMSFHHASVLTEFQEGNNPDSFHH